MTVDFFMYEKEAELLRDSLFTLFCYELYTITLLSLFRP